MVVWFLYGWGLFGWFCLPPPCRCELQDTLRVRFFEPGTEQRSPSLSARPPPARGPRFVHPYLSPLAATVPPGAGLQSAFLCGISCWGPACVTPLSGTEAILLHPCRHLWVSGPQTNLQPLRCLRRVRQKCCCGVLGAAGGTAGSRGPDFCILSESSQKLARRCIPAATERDSAPCCAA